MDKRTEFRFNHDRKLETYADMAGMTIYPNESNHVTDLLYEDYSFGDPVEPWRLREELFGLDPDEERLSDKTCDRYFIDYWKVMGGPYRHCGSNYKTQKDLENEIKEKEARNDKRAEAARLKKEAADAKALKQRLEFIAWDRERREQRRVAKAERAKEKLRERAREWNAIQTVQATGRKPRPPITSLTPNEIRALRRQPRPFADVRDRRYNAAIARRTRQKEAMDTGAMFSTSQQPGSAGVITWGDPLITDVRLVRLVLSADRWSREMTADEESDYWYWKARGK